MSAEPVSLKHAALNRTHGLHVEPLAHERALERQGIESPSFRDLMKHVKKHGGEGVLESAMHLSDDEFEQLTRAVHVAARSKRRKR